MPHPFRIPLWTRIVIAVGVLVNVAIVTGLVPDGLDRIWVVWLQLVANVVVLLVALWLIVQMMRIRRSQSSS